MSVTTQGSFSTQEAGTQAANTAITTVGAGTLTGAALASTIITRTGPVAAYIDTTDTAALIYAALTSGNLGESFEVTIKNMVAFDCTLAAGSGMTLSGQSVIPGLSWARFLVTISGAATGTMQGIASGALATLPQSKFTTTAGASPITAAAGDLTGAEHVVFRVTTAGAFGLTTRTAAEMFADTPNAQIGTAWLLTIVSQGNNTVTVTGGSNVTITGTATIATKVSRTFVCTFTSATALTMQGVDKGTIE